MQPQFGLLTLDAKLESVQRCAAHFVMNNYFQSSSVSNMLSYLHWKAIARISLQTLIRLQMLHKIVYNYIDVSLPSYVIHRSKHARNAATTFIEIGSTVDAYKFSFSPSTIACGIHCQKIVIMLTLLKIPYISFYYNFTFSFV